MCFICDGGTPDEYMRLIESHIDQYDWHVAGVEASEPYLSWMYTIGLSEKFGHPELVVNGLCCMECGHMTLNGVGTLVAEGARFEAGGEAREPDGPGRSRIGAVHPHYWRTNMFNLWLDYYDGKPWAPAPRALHVITVGKSGRWQNDSMNRRWRYERLDRAPHLRGKRLGRRSA